MQFQDKTLKEAEKKALSVIACELILGCNFCTPSGLAFRMNLNEEATNLIIKSLVEKGQIDFRGNLYLNFADEKINNLYWPQSGISKEAVGYVDFLVDRFMNMRTEVPDKTEH